MNEYRYLEDIWSQGKDIFKDVQFSSRGYGKRYYISSIISSAHKVLQKHYTEMTATKQLPTQVMDRHAMSEEGLEDAFLSYNKCEEYIQRIVESYWNSFDYFIDGKKVTPKEFFIYAKQIHLVKKGEGDNAEYWTIAQRGIGRTYREE